MCDFQDWCTLMCLRSLVGLIKALLDIDEASLSVNVIYVA